MATSVAPGLTISDSRAVPTSVKDCTRRQFPSTGRALRREAIIFLKHFAEFLVRQRDNFVILDAGHGFGGDHGVDDGFFGGLHARGKEAVQMIVPKHFQTHYIATNSPPY